MTRVDELVTDLKLLISEHYALEMVIEENTRLKAEIENIKQDIEKAMDEYYYSEHDLGVRQGFRFALEIIDNHTKGDTNEDKKE